MYAKQLLLLLYMKLPCLLASRLSPPINTTDLLSTNRNDISLVALGIRVGADSRFGRIPDIEIIRPVIQYCRMLGLSLLKLAGRLSDN